MVSPITDSTLRKPCLSHYNHLIIFGKERTLERRLSALFFTFKYIISDVFLKHIQDEEEN